MAHTPPVLLDNQNSKYHGYSFLSKNTFISTSPVIRFLLKYKQDSTKKGKVLSRLESNKNASFCITCPPPPFFLKISTGVLRLGSFNNFEILIKVFSLSVCIHNKHPLKVVPIKDT